MFTIKFMSRDSENYPDIRLVHAEHVEIVMPSSKFHKKYHEDKAVGVSRNTPFIIADGLNYPIEGRDIAFIMNSSGATIETVKGLDFV